MDITRLQNLARLIRYYILKMSTIAGSGHPTSSLSAADLMTVLFFNGFFHFDFAHPDDLANDRLIFSKGHATPLFYALYAAAGAIKPEELATYRQFDSRLEGHATMRFPFTEAATGSLGQGLSVGVGLAMGIKKIYDLRFKNYEAKEPKNIHKSYIINHKSTPSVFVLLGDGEMSEGSVWEAINLASYYQLDNLVAIVDVNRLGQSGETMLGWDVKKYEKRFQAFGWRTVTINGHDYREIIQAFKQVSHKDTPEVASHKDTPGAARRVYPVRNSPGVEKSGKPLAIIAKTVKGRGISFLENKENWHGKPLKQEQFEQAVKELGKVDLAMRGKVEKPRLAESGKRKAERKEITSRFTLHASRYSLGDQVPTRKAYGSALARLGEVYPQIVSLDGDVKNSTYAEIFQTKYPQRFFEMFIAEQNMVGAAAGFGRVGFIPFVSTFAAFLTRGFDQIRMSAIGEANIKFCGSHAGVSIGEDGPSQMGLEDIAMFRSIYNSVVLYPADAVSCEKLVEEMIKHRGICYLRTSRPPTPVIYNNDEKFPIGGCKIHYLNNRHPGKRGTSASRIPRGFWTRRVPDGNPSSQNDKRALIIIAAGITLFEALKAQQELAKERIEAIVVDCYSIKPIAEKTLKNLLPPSSNQGETLVGSNRTIPVITVEDHWFDGGLGDAVLNVFAEDDRVKVHKLAVTKMPQSGRPQQLLDFEKISAKAIVDLVHHIKS